MRIGFVVVLVSVARGLGTCSTDSISCPSDGADSCCTPAIGKIVLAQQWIEGFGPPEAFTLHGLWPNYCNGTYPPSQGCDGGRVYDNIFQLVQNDHDLYQEMQELWPSYNNDNGVFWTHEWVKHGTCLSTAEPKCISEFAPGKDALAYFRTALKARAKFDFYKALEKHGIVPGRTYSRDSIIAALAVFGGKSSLFCKGRVLEEVQSAFHVQGSDNFVMIDSDAKSNCPSNIVYPRKLQRPSHQMKLIDYSVSILS